MHVVDSATGYTNPSTAFQSISFICSVQTLSSRSIYCKIRFKGIVPSIWYDKYQTTKPDPDPPPGLAATA